MESAPSFVFILLYPVISNFLIPRPSVRTHAYLKEGYDNVGQKGGATSDNKTNINAILLT